MIPVVGGSSPLSHPIFRDVRQMAFAVPASFATIPLLGPLAQLVEQLTLNQLVESSNLSRPTNKKGA